MKINYITNFDLNSTSGGWNGINYKLSNELRLKLKLNYIGPIDPQISRIERFISRVQKFLKIDRNYFFFSERRLKNININYINNRQDTDLDFFFGATPWVECDVRVKYVVYLDIIFPHYVKLFLQDEKFSTVSINKICKKEMTFLQNASHIFWGSNWAKNEAELYYECKFKNSTVISTGGHIPRPDTFNTHFSKLNLLFISLNFNKKGGNIAYAALTQLKMKYKHIKLVVIGEKPPLEILNDKNVEYVGMLDKNNPDDIKTFQIHFNQSFFLVHPTVMDTMGAVIAESGYFGLPTIAPDNFGIPDLIKHKETGLLLRTPIDVNEIVNWLLYYLENENEYKLIRENAFRYYNLNHSWVEIATKIINKIK